MRRTRPRLTIVSPSTFYIGDFVWVMITCDCFLVGEYNKLKDRKIGRCEVLQKINNNAYKLHLPNHIKTSYMFMSNTSVHALSMMA